MQFNWDNLQYFTLLVTHKTLSAAADALGVQHTTVARHIGELEQSLGVALFDRVGKRYVLTEQGMYLYQSAHHIAADMQQLQADMQHRRRLAAQVSVSLPPVVARRLLAHLPVFYAQHADICLILHSSAALSDLHGRQADIALRMVYPDRSDLVVRRLCDVGFGFFAHGDYLAATANTDRRYFILSTKNALSAWADIQTAGQQVAMRCNDFDIIYQAVTARLGVGLLPIDSAQQSGLVAAAVTDEVQTTQPLYMVMHEGIRHVPKVRAVAQFLTAALASQP